MGLDPKSPPLDSGLGAGMTGGRVEGGMGPRIREDKGGESRRQHDILLPSVDIYACEWE